jgi:hypothetical protein
MPRLALLPLAILSLALLIPGCHSRSVATPLAAPADGTLAGLAENTVRSQLGQPRLEFAGHYGLPNAASTRPYTGQIKTSVFAVSGGDEYVSFEKRQGVWVAVFNNWLPKGGVF